MWIKSSVTKRFYYFDFQDIFLDSIDSILDRLQIEHLDSLLLHRRMPSWNWRWLTFDHLEQARQGRHFWGVQSKSNDDGIAQNGCQTASQVNQLQLSAAFTPKLWSWFHVNMEGPKSNRAKFVVSLVCRPTDTVIPKLSLSSSMAISKEICRQERRVCDPQSHYSITKNTKSLRQLSPLLGSSAILVGCRLSSDWQTTYPWSG